MKMNAFSMKRPWLQLLLMSLWNGEAFNLALVAEILLFVLLWFMLLTIGNCSLYYCKTLSSYCQRIGRPDFWGGESELLVSIWWLRHIRPFFIIRFVLFFSWCSLELDQWYCKKPTGDDYSCCLVGIKAYWVEFSIIDLNIIVQNGSLIGVFHTFHRNSSIYFWGSNEDLKKR